MIRSGLTVVLLIVTSLLFSQNKSVKLEWQGVYSDRIGIETAEILAFDGAVYSEDNGMLPQYYVSFALDGEFYGSGDFMAVAQNQQWQSLDSISVFEGSDEVKKELEIQLQVVTSRNKKRLDVWVTPIRKGSAGNFEKLVSFDLVIERQLSRRTKSASLLSGYVTQSALSSGKWVKVSIAETGIYKLTYSDIEAMGLDPKKIRLFGYGGNMLDVKYGNRLYDDMVENAVYYNDGGDGTMDPEDFILFYGQGTEKWTYNSSNDEFEHDIHKFSDKACYFLTSDKGVGLKMTVADEPGSAETTFVNEFTDYQFYEPEFQNLLKSGSEWYSLPISSNSSLSHTFTFDDLITTENAKISFELASRTISSSANITFSLDGNSLGDVSAPVSSNGVTGVFAQIVKGSYSVKPSGTNMLLRAGFQASESTSSAWLDYMRVNVRRKLALNESFLRFRDARSIGTGSIALFNVESTKSQAIVIDVTNPVAPLIMPTTYNSGIISYKALAEEVREYVAFDPSASFEKPKTEGQVINQNLHGLPQVDMVIISHPDFVSASNDLAAMHAQDGLSVITVTPEQIYNEFSSGQKDITAFRWFLKMFYDRASSDDDMIKYLLLMGDGSYDNKGILNDQLNKIPTYQSDNSLNLTSTYVSDDYFALLDDDEGSMGNSDLVDLGVGRLPVSTAQQAQEVVNKIKYYHDNRKRSVWKNSVCFVGDDEDNNIHMRDANRMADKVMSQNPEMVVEKIFLDAYLQTAESSGQRYPDAEDAVEKSIGQGVLLWNYSGHGGEAGLTEEQIMTKKKINNYDNLSTLPVWVTATCEFSRFDLFTETTAGELVLLNPKGGGVSLFTTTRIVYSSSNFTINNNFFDFVFSKDANGLPYRLGDVCRLTKEKTGTGVNKRKFMLLGDPALQLVYPELKVKTSHINDVDISEGPVDTISAYETLTVRGYIANENGDTITGFNGSVYPQVYDKMVRISTLNNDNEASSLMSFNLWRDLLYVGKADVTNGLFEFSFKVPKEINYEFGNGRIVYYASSDEAEASGYFEDFVLGGFGQDAVEDNLGPTINVFLNDPGFENGSSVNPDPLLIAEIKDENGISTAGSGIGHDIVAILDDDPNTLQNLNSYYEAVEGNTEGLVKFKFNDLAEGEHTLFFRVWDIYNNSSSQTITFFVENSEKPDIVSLYCYPNPARDNVEFVFNHDRPESVLDIQIEIFNINGKKVAVLESYSYSGSYKVDPVYWDLTSGNGMKVVPGMYLYRSKITVDGVQSIGKTEKLIVL